MEFTDLHLANEQQIAFCKKLGLDVHEDTTGVAAAKIQERIQIEFWGISDLDKPTKKQIDLAFKYDINILHFSRIVGDAYINDIMTQLNKNAIKQHQLAPGVSVKNIYDSFDQIYIISSIKEDGTVYFKGGNGKKAWARSLVNVNT